MDFRSVFKKILIPGSDGTPGRTSGRPTSSNGASSFHLHWEVPPTPLVETSATFEVLEPPGVSKLYFWALQVSFMNGQARQGGAHFGLQFNPNYPQNGAVNWGGYHEGGGILDGTISPLPSAPDDRNTRDYRWYPNRLYRHRIYKSPERGWRGSITDVATGHETVVRDLLVEGDHLVNPMVWSEVFADCDHPSTAVRWTDLEATTASGDVVRPSAVRLNYQSFSAGGCANTNTSVDGSGYVQRTTTERVNKNGTRLQSGKLP